MAFDITGISNENDFYPHHYLSTLFQDDVRGILRSWKKGEMAPWHLLRDLYRPFFEAKNAINSADNDEERLQLQRTFVAKILYALGYTLRHAQGHPPPPPPPIFGLHSG